MSEVTQISYEQKIEALNLHEIGARDVPISGDSVPEDCFSGFGTWHPTKRECVICPYVPLCFCKATDTTPPVMENAMKRAEKAPDPTFDPIPTSKKINPFRKNSYYWSGIVLLIELVRRGISRVTQEEMYNIAKELGLKFKPEHPEWWYHDFMQVLDDSRVHKKRDERMQPFFGTVTQVGDQPSMTRTWDINVARITEMMKEYESE